MMMMIPFDERHSTKFSIHFRLKNKETLIKIEIERHNLIFDSKLLFFTISYLTTYMTTPVVMYGYESWTVKKAEHRRIDAFEL